MDATEIKENIAYAGARWKGARKVTSIIRHRGQEPLVHYVSLHKGQTGNAPLSLFARGAEHLAGTLPVENDKAMPLSDYDMSSWGYRAWRCLPDGTVVGVMPTKPSQPRGAADLCWNLDRQGYKDHYSYASIDQAVTALLEFDPSRDKEPQGWEFHVASGRRRPGGDPALEYTNA